MKVIIGLDPHKASHTAVAVDRDEQELASLQVRANATQMCRLLEWSAPFPERTWAIEGAGGLGYLLGQQLVSAGETVVDVPATLASRVRVLGSGRSNENDPNDARSVAIAACRTSSLTPVRLPQITRRCWPYWLAGTSSCRASRTRTVCRLHAVIRELVEGGASPKLKADK